MSEDAEKKDRLTKPQAEALFIFREIDAKQPGAWHRSAILGKRSRNAWRLLELGLVERREVLDKTGKAFAFEYRISDAGKKHGATNV